MLFACHAGMHDRYGVSMECQDLGDNVCVVMSLVVLNGLLDCLSSTLCNWMQIKYIAIGRDRHVLLCKSPRGEVAVKIILRSTALVSAVLLYFSLFLQLNILYNQVESVVFRNVLNLSLLSENHKSCDYAQVPI